MSHTSSVAVTPARPLVWAWPLAILVGFPIGGLLANVIVGRVDSVGAALAGGLVAGAVIGTAQWLALRPLVPWIWAAATSIGMAVGLAAGAALVDYGTGRGDVVPWVPSPASSSAGSRLWSSRERASRVRDGGRSPTLRRGRSAGSSPRT